MRVMFAVLVCVLVVPSAAAAVLPPYMDDQGSAGTSCRWNPYAELVCGAGSCAWRGEWQWFTFTGIPTGERCA